MSAKTKTPAFSTRAVSACLTRAGLSRKKRSKGCRAWYGDFYVGEVAAWTLPKGAPPTIEVAVTNPAGGGDIARQINQARAAEALEAAGYVLGRNDPRAESKFDCGRIWVIDGASREPLQPSKDEPLSRSHSKQRPVR